MEHNMKRKTFLYRHTKYIVISHSPNNMNSCTVCMYVVIVLADHHCERIYVLPYDTRAIKVP